MSNTAHPGTRRSRQSLVWSITLIIVLVALGVLLLLWYPKIAGETLRELVRDIGMALLVSAVVGGLFELYRSTRLHVETMRDVVDLTMGEKVTPEVWLELRDLIETRRVVRKSVRIECILEPSLAAHEAILQIKQKYELHALTPTSDYFKVEHELDYHMRKDELKLPKFKDITIKVPGVPGVTEAHLFKIDEGSIQSNYPDGKVSVEIRLLPRGSQPALVSVERHELVHVPGSYNLYSAELMKGLSVTFTKCIYEVKPEIFVRPHGHGMGLELVDGQWSCDHLLLPGQGIEMKFPISPPEASHIDRASGA
jgi:hypothetical protein